MKIINTKHHSSIVQQSPITNRSQLLHLTAIFRSSILSFNSHVPSLIPQALHDPLSLSLSRSNKKCKKKKEETEVKSEEEERILYMYLLENHRARAFNLVGPLSISSITCSLLEHNLQIHPCSLLNSAWKICLIWRFWFHIWLVDAIRIQWLLWFLEWKIHEIDYCGKKDSCIDACLCGRSRLSFGVESMRVWDAWKR